MTIKRDSLFSDKSRAIGDFNFGKQTAEVFDDMLDRSIPMYRELQRMIGEITREFSAAGTNVYDLGCSTGITLETLHLTAAPSATLVGLDYSQAMLDRARLRFLPLIESGRMRLDHADLNQGCLIENASVVVLNLTLQFVRPLYRDSLMRQIVSGLNDHGVLILVEKVLATDSTINRLFIKFYYDMKRRNGYDEMEIAQKREALENVLIPYRVDENVELLKRCGCQEVETFYRWYNFCGFVAHKNLGDKWVLAANATYEQEWEKEEGETEKESVLEFTLGAAYRITPNWSVGLEARYHAVYEGLGMDEHLGTGWFLGPNVHYGTSKWWATLTVLPQIAGNPGDGHNINTTEHQIFEARLIFGINF